MKDHFAGGRPNQRDERIETESVISMKIFPIRRNETVCTGNKVVSTLHRAGGQVKIILFTHQLSVFLSGWLKMLLQRSRDIVCALLALAVFVLPMTLIALAVCMTSKGPALYWSQRVGRGNKHFWMPKFRTMRTDTPVVATHLLGDPARHMTPIGSFLRKTSLDETPQIWCILKGEMSLVGPRPALFNQDDLIAARTAQNVHLLQPGLTGWAQVNGRDELTIPAKVALDTEYLKRRSFLFDLRILAMTVVKVVGAADIRH